MSNEKSEKQNKSLRDFLYLHILRLKNAKTLIMIAMITMIIIMN